VVYKDVGSCHIKAEEIMAMYPRLRYYVPSLRDDVLEVDIMDLLPGDMALVSVNLYSFRDSETFTILLKHVFKTRKQAHRSRKRWEKSIKKQQNEPEKEDV